MRDTEGNGYLNLLEYLGGPKDESDYGNHAVLFTEDSTGLNIVNGNHTPPPKFTSSRLSNWQEGILLSRQWDARGHAGDISPQRLYYAHPL